MINMINLLYVLSCYFVVVSKLFYIVLFSSTRWWKCIHSFCWRWLQEMNHGITL